MAQKYQPQAIESKWQKYWEDRGLFTASNDSAKPSYYCLIEFPYPSGEGLHVGHPRSYTALDILARKRRMEGHNVLYPIGFDAFGLPSENYAIKTGIHPAITTKKNIETFTRQLKALGFSFDWSRVVNTTDPAYYKWTQWIFLKLYEHDMAYKANITINWCPSCKIGLANEEVVDGKCERCGTVVEQRQKEQWMLKITKYADRLIKDLETVDYLERIKQQQINWIGRSEGAYITFQIKGAGQTITVFTTRPDTLFGATFMVLAPEHELLKKVEKQITNIQAVREYISMASKKTEIERTSEGKVKTGVKLEGVLAVNPATGEEIPIFIADYVLATYGTGAIMAVPAHDQRDWEFAKKYDLPIMEVVAGGDVAQGAYTAIETGSLINSGKFDGLDVAAGSAAIVNWLAEKNLAQKTVTYKLRDWVFSRQRYWGEPIPMIQCEKCGWVSVPEEQLPIELPAVEKYEPTDTGESPLSAITEWVNTTCPKCGGAAKRETDTMPNWAGSNWYFIRYTDAHNTEAMASSQAMEQWLPVDWYNGGMEHTTLHLLYSRFIYKFLFDIGAVPKQCGPEPYQKRTSHGLILGEGGEKMSKSKGNVVNPDQVVKQYGADTLRLYEMFMGPFDQAIPWDDKGVVGVRRFLDRVWQAFTESQPQASAPATLTALTHRTIKKVSNDIETQDYNTAVSALMILLNEINKQQAFDMFVAESFLQLLSPFAPHIAEELWQTLGHTESIALAKWPSFDEALLVHETIKLVVQINGKVRATIEVPADITEQNAERLAREQALIAKYLLDAEVKNIIFVPGRLINFVI